MAKWRPESVGQQVREILSELVRSRLKDPRLGFVTITSVEMTRDLQTARVYLSVMGDQAARDATLEALRHASAFLRRELGRQVRLRHTPELLFAYDDSIERGARINRLLDGLES